MIRGLNSAASGLIVQNKTLDVLGNNIANISTPGFKKDNLISTAFKEQLAMRLEYQDSPTIGNVTLSNAADEVVTSFEQGAPQKTGRALDMCIEGEGFFVLENPDGGQWLTRNGQFKIDAEGYLYSLQGGRVIGQNGLIKVGTEDFTVSENGEIAVNGQKINSFTVYVPQNYNALNKQGEGFFSINGGTGMGFGGRIKQGYLEMSNVDVTREMTDIMASSRAFQSCSQVVKILDETLEKTVTEIGRI